MVKHSSISESKANINEATGFKDTYDKDIIEAMGEPSTQIFEGEHGLPVLYESTLPEPKNLVDTDTNNISVLWHELISPLTLIKGYAATLLQLGNSITKDQEQQYLQGIDNASNRVIRLLENIRDITRLEESEALTLLRVSLPDIIRSVALDIQNQTNNNIIKVHVDSKLPFVKADPEKIEMVLNNIITNAIKYSPRGGDIEIGVKLAKTEQELQKICADAPEIKLPSLVVNISDNGEGIPKVELERIFEKFYRVKNRLTQVTQGAGLGLYICRIIIKAHKGHIWARNKLQSGSIFYFSLPLE